MYKTVQINCFRKVFCVTAYPCVSTSVPLTYVLAFEFEGCILFLSPGALQRLSQNGTYDLMVIEGFILVNMVSPVVRILSLIILSCLLLVLIDFKPVGQPFLQILRLQVDATQALFYVNAVCNVELHTGTIHTWNAGTVD